jgi:hypothetical protein
MGDQRLQPVIFQLLAQVRRAAVDANNITLAGAKAFGLDNDMTIVEHVPLVIKANQNLPLKRVFDR